MVYDDGAAVSTPLPLLQKSLAAIKRAVDETMHHDIQVTTSSWEPVPGNPFIWNVGHPKGKGHAAIVEQIRGAVEGYTHFASAEWDALVFLEHDVLYPPDYFDRMGNALASGAPVASNLDYEGLNATGWLRVKERHEPMHQLAMRRDVALANLDRAQAECRATGQALLEPQGDRSEWARLPVVGLCPAVHVNHPKRFTAHGEVCYEAHSGGKTIHPFWGDFRQWWPGEADMTQQQPQKSGCNSCGGPAAPPPFASVEDWFEHVKHQPSDFHEHVEAMRDLASKSEIVVELSSWLKPALLALAAGHPKVLRSVCPGQKPEWPQLKQLLGGTDFAGLRSDSLAADPFPSDLLFVDTRHAADQLYAELSRWAPLCHRWLVIHCTETYGEKGDDGGPGVLPALRRYVRENPRWAVVDHSRANHGLTVLSCDPADRPALPSTVRQVLNFAKAVAKHKLSPLPLLSEEQVEARLDVCALCKLRLEERCSKCGCPLIEGAAGMPGKALLATEDCPLAMWPANK